VVGMQAPQTLLAGPPDMERGQVPLVGARAHAPEDLRGQHDALAASAPLREPAADDLLGDPLSRLPSVDVGGVEEVDSELEGPVHEGEAVGLRGQGAEVHGAETEPAYL